MGDGLQRRRDPSGRWSPGALGRCALTGDRRSTHVCEYGNCCGKCATAAAYERRKLGVSNICSADQCAREQRLYVLPAWRESPFYSDRERAALAWTEAVTLLKHNR